MSDDTGLAWASHSSLVKHRTCPQKWMYAHIRRLEKDESTDIAVERDFGSWWHTLRAADSIQRGRLHESLQWVPEELTTTNDGPRILTAVDEEITLVEKVMLAAEKWNENQHPDLRAVWVERIGEELPDRLAAVYERWSDQWADEIANERPLAVELKWERRLPDMPASWVGPGMRVDPRAMLVGYVDEIYFDVRRNLVVARDHKTSKKLSTQSTADDMMDSQLQLYAWGSDLIVKGWGYPGIQATSYDRTRMTKATTPKLTLTGTLSKTVSDFDVRTYLEFCRGEDGEGVPFPGRLKDGSGAGLYTAEAEVIERLSTPAATSVWFQRTLTPLNPNLIKTHLLSAVDTVIDVGESRKRIEESGQAARNLSINNCRWCDFNKICRAEMIGGSDGDWDLAEFGLHQGERRGRS